MTEYARVHAGAVTAIVDLDPAAHAAWVAVGNPKAESHLPLISDPLPIHDPSIQVVEPQLAIEAERVRRSWTVRPKTAEERRQVWTAFEFLQRFTASERAAIRTGSMSDPALADFLMMSQAAQEIVSDDPMTGAGMDYLVSLGILTPARRAEILP